MKGGRGVAVVGERTLKRRSAWREGELDPIVVGATEDVAETEAVVFLQDFDFLDSGGSFRCLLEDFIDH
jgi:hypothetical protein